MERRRHREHDRHVLRSVYAAGVFVDTCQCLDAEHPFNQSQIVKANESWSYKMVCLNNTYFTDGILQSLQTAISLTLTSATLSMLVLVNGGYVHINSLFEFVRKSYCFLELRLTLARDMGSCSCPLLCSEYTYDLTTFGSPLPHRFYQLAFYNEYVAPHPEIYGNKFDIYADIRSDVGNVSDAGIMRHLDDVKLMRKNFVRISDLFDSYSIFEIKENSTMTVDNLVSSVGGALSLWMGITATFLIEVLELFYNIVYNILRNIIRNRNILVV